MARAKGRDELRSKCKAITALLPYAVWRERDGEPVMLNTFLRAAWASGVMYFTWHRIDRFAGPLLSGASPRAIVLTSPHIPWYLLTDRKDLVRQWAAATSLVPCTEEVAQCVVDTLLQIASRKKLLPHIKEDLWAWMTRRPYLPPVCAGRYYATYPHVAKAVRKLQDVEILKSYLLLTWSEWDALWNEGFAEACASILVDLCGTRMKHHRVDLVQRLDHVLGELDQGLEYLQRRNPNLREYDFDLMVRQYRRLREAITRGSLPTVTFLHILTPAEMRRTPHDVHVRASSPMSVAIHLYQPRVYPLYISLHHPFSHRIHKARCPPDFSDGRAPTLVPANTRRLQWNRAAQPESQGGTHPGDARLARETGGVFKVITCYLYVLSNY